MINELKNLPENEEEFASELENNPENISENNLEANPEEINAKIEEQLNNLEINGAELAKTVDSLGGEEKLKEKMENDEEKSGDIFKQARNIILIIGAISAISIVYNIVKPGALSKLLETNENYLVIGAVSLATAATIFGVVKLVKTGELVKEIKEVFSLKSFKKIGEERRKKKERHERFMERNFNN